MEKKHNKALREIEQSQADNAIGIADGNADSNAPSPPPSLEGDGGGGEIATPLVEAGGDSPPSDPSYDDIVDLAVRVSSKHSYPDVQKDVDKHLADVRKPKDIFFALWNLLMSDETCIRGNARSYFMQKLAERAD